MFLILSYIFDAILNLSLHGLKLILHILSELYPKYKYYWIELQQMLQNMILNIQRNVT